MMKMMMMMIKVMIMCSSSSSSSIVVVVDYKRLSGGLAFSWLTAPVLCVLRIAVDPFETNR